MTSFYIIIIIFFFFRNLCVLFLGEKEIHLAPQDYVYVYILSSFSHTQVHIYKTHKNNIFPKSPKSDVWLYHLTARSKQQGGGCSTLQSKSLVCVCVCMRVCVFCSHARWAHLTYDHLGHKHAQVCTGVRACMCVCVHAILHLLSLEFPPTTALRRQLQITMLCPTSLKRSTGPTQPLLHSLTMWCILRVG